MGKRIYVGNLPFSVTQEDLQVKFERFGTVESATLVVDRDTGRGRGFGFVEMASDTEAQAAIKSLNATDYDGLTMSVRTARPKRTGPATQNRPRRPW